MTEADQHNLHARMSVVEATMAANTATVNRVDENVRDMGVTLSQIRIDLATYETHGSGLERAFAEIKKTNERMDEFFREMVRGNELRAEEHTKWRTDHVADNVKSDKVLGRFASIAISGTIFIGVIVSLVSYVYVTDKQNRDRDADAARQERRELDHRQDRIEQTTLILCARTNVDCKPFR
jgi:hypothetical protein